MLFHDGRIKFTLKLLDFVSEYKCKPIFDRLNKKETDVKISNGVQDQRFLKNGWGGSDGVGGPPRYPNGAGTFLGLNTIKTEVAEELKEQTAQIQALQKQEELNRLAKHTESNGSK